MIRKFSRPLFLCTFCFLLSNFTYADVKPSPLFSDHMVLQQNMKLPIWGTADAGEQVTVTLGTEKQTATADDKGNWRVTLPAQKPSDSAEMTIAGKNSITIQDILIGEVWLGSGQSNMQFPVSKAKGSYAGLINEAEEIAAANYPKLRMFTVKRALTYEPLATLTGEWQVCTPQNVPSWSAVAYLFGRDLQRELKTPVGLIVSAEGASSAESWVSREAMAADPILKPTLDRFDAAVDFFKKNPTATLSAAPPIPTTINKPRSPNGRFTDPVKDHHQPIVDFNGMINPVIPYAIKGVIWYQGESIINGDAGLSNYGRVMAALVKDWRSRWSQGEFPFYVVQLPALKNISNNPRVREQQATILQLPNTGMAVTVDIGDPNDVHPHNKAPLGERLTLIALANAYGHKVEYSGPLFDSVKIAGNTATITFTHSGGLTAKGGDPKWFQIAGAGQKFVDATAKIVGDTVVVSADSVKEPVAVRYAWDNYPDTANLYNAAALPAAPFRTDTWTYPIAGLVE